LFAFDLTAEGNTIPGRRLGALLAGAKRTDCRAMCVGADGKVWACVTEHGLPGGQVFHMVSYTPGAKAPRDHGPVGIANPDYTPFKDAAGKPLPWHHTVRKHKDGTLHPWQPLGIATARDGTVYALTLAPFTLLKITPEKLK